MLSPVVQNEYVDNAGAARRVDCAEDRGAASSGERTAAVKKKTFFYSILAACMHLSAGHVYMPISPPLL